LKNESRRLIAMLTLRITAGLAFHTAFFVA